MKKATPDLLLLCYRLEFHSTKNLLNSLYTTLT
jgi:hypothetical protein